MTQVAVFSPAKINLMLAITGRRADGFHELVSLVAPLAFGDRLWIEVRDEPGPVELICSDGDLPTGDENLAVKAAELFRRELPTDRGLLIRLDKRIPVGAGLGGGSSNAAAVLRALNTVFHGAVESGRLRELAAEIGSDCALFLETAPSVIRGRGERVTPVEQAVARRLEGRPVILIKPDFSVSTPWAYGRMAAESPRHYRAPDEAEESLKRFCEDEIGLPAFLANNMQAVVFEKYPALPVLLDGLKERFGVPAMMSGSGSTCFVLPDGEADIPAMRALVAEWLGPEALVVETCIL